MSAKVASDLELGGVSFPMDTSLSSTSYNWPVITKPQYDRKSDEEGCIYIY